MSPSKQYACSVARPPADQKGLAFEPMGETQSRLRAETKELLGDVLEGRYRVDAIIGAGATGTVFRAHHLGLKRDVAVKVLHAQLVSDDTARERFQREAEAASKLDPPQLHPRHRPRYDQGRRVVLRDGAADGGGSCARSWAARCRRRGSFS